MTAIVRQRHHERLAQRIDCGHMEVQHKQGFTAMARTPSLNASVRPASLMATDAAEDAMFGEGRGDEMRDDPGPGSAQSARIAEALADLQAERAAAGFHTARDDPAPVAHPHPGGIHGPQPRKFWVGLLQTSSMVISRIAA